MKQPIDPITIDPIFLSGTSKCKFLGPSKNILKAPGQLRAMAGMAIALQRQLLPDPNDDFTGGVGKGIRAVWREGRFFSRTQMRVYLIYLQK